MYNTQMYKTFKKTAIIVFNAAFDRCWFIRRTTIHSSFNCPWRLRTSLILRY